jgi:hypothetical protein
MRKQKERTTLTDRADCKLRRRSSADRWPSRDLFTEGHSAKNSRSLGMPEVSDQYYSDFLRTFDKALAEALESRKLRLEERRNREHGGLVFSSRGYAPSASVS